MATDFYVYHSDGTDTPESPFETEVQTLIPALDAEEGGAANVIELNPFSETFVPPEGHDLADILGNYQVTVPAVVAERSGNVIRIKNFNSAAELAPATLLGAGGDLNETVLDGLETQVLAQLDVDEAADERTSAGDIELQECERMLLGGDLLTSDEERGCFANLVRVALDLPVTQTQKFVAETEVDIERFASDIDGIANDGAGGGGIANDSISHQDFSQAQGFMRKVGDKAYEAIKTNLEAAGAPTVNDDETLGYAIGSRWIYNGVEYVCEDATATAASWIALGAPAGGEQNDGENVGTGAGVYKDKSGLNIRMRRLQSSDDTLEITENADDIDLIWGDDALVESLKDVVISSPKNGDLLVLTECPPGTFTWKNSPSATGGGSGEVNELLNVGGGVEIGKTKTGILLPIRTLVAGPGISVVQNTDTIQINNTSTPVFGEDYQDDTGASALQTTTSTTGALADVFIPSVGAPFTGRYLLQLSFLLGNSNATKQSFAELFRTDGGSVLQRRSGTTSPAAGDPVAVMYEQIYNLSAASPTFALYFMSISSSFPAEIEEIIWKWWRVS